jgi:hypothetical protein
LRGGCAGCHADRLSVQDQLSGGGDSSLLIGVQFNLFMKRRIVPEGLAQERLRGHCAAVGPFEATVEHSDSATNFSSGAKHLIFLLF